MCLPRIQPGSCHYLIPLFFTALDAEQKEGQFHDYLKLQPPASSLWASVATKGLLCLAVPPCETPGCPLNPELSALAHYDCFMTAEGCCVLPDHLDQL